MGGGRQECSSARNGSVCWVMLQIHALLGKVGGGSSANPCSAGKEAVVFCRNTKCLYNCFVVGGKWYGCEEVVEGAEGG